VFADKSLNSSEFILDLKLMWGDGMKPEVKAGKSDEILL
jgi:hypothetical protein